MRPLSSLCAVSAKCQHAFDIMSVIGGEKLFGGRSKVFVFIHTISRWVIDCDALPISL